MTARPSQDSDSWKTWAIAQLALLFAVVVDLVHKDKRGQGIVTVLMRALQAARENTLVGVLVKGASSTQDILSLLIVNTSMSDPLRKYLTERGVRYVGEMYRVVWDARGPGVRERQAEAQEFLRTLGLPEGLPESMWRPSYWDDPMFIALLNTPLGEVLKDTYEDNTWVHNQKLPQLVGGWKESRKRRQQRDYNNEELYLTSMLRIYHSQGIHYVGTWLTKGGCGFGVGYLRNRQTGIAPNTGLWAAAMVPPDWQAPSDVPDEWKKELVLIEEEKAQARPPFTTIIKANT